LNKIKKLRPAKTARDEAEYFQFHGSTRIAGKIPTSQIPVHARITSGLIEKFRFRRLSGAVGFLHADTVFSADKRLSVSFVQLKIRSLSTI